MYPVGTKILAICWWKVVAGKTKSWLKLDTYNGVIFIVFTKTIFSIGGTLRAKSSLIEDLLEKGYHYVMTDLFQIDPLERRFRPNRQMNNDFLASCREVCSSEYML